MLLGALAARLPNLDESLWNDEIVYTRIMLESKSLSWVLFHDVHPPLYALIMLGWIRLFGDGEVAVRLPSLLFGLLSVAMVFWLARRWFRNPVAYLAAILVALSPPHIWYSQENKTNMLVVFLSVVAMYALWRAWTRNRWTGWLVFTAAAVLALWSHAFNLFIVLSGLAWIALQCFRPDGRTRIKGAIGATAGIAVGMLPLVYGFFREGGGLERGYLRPFTLPEVYKFVFIYLGHGNTLRNISPYAGLDALFQQPAYLFAVDAFVAALVLLGFRALLKGRRNAPGSGDPAAATVRRATNELLAAWFVLPLVGLLLGSLVYPEIYVERSLLILLPPFCLLAAVGALGFRRVAIQGILVAALLAFQGAALYHYWVVKADRWTVYKQNPDWRGVMDHLGRQRLRSASRVVPVLLTCPEGALLYYLDLFRVEQVKREDPARPAPRIMLLKASAPAREAIHAAFQRDGIRLFFLVLNRSWDEDHGQLLAAYRHDPRYRVGQPVPFKEIDVFEIHRVDP